jgi:hypothetical protein
MSEYGALYSDGGVDDLIFGAFDGDSPRGVRRGLSRQPGLVHRQHRLPGDPHGLRQPRSRRDVVDSQWLHHRSPPFSTPPAASETATEHRRVFLCGLVVFTVGSAACGLSGSFVMLVASRVVQALGAAMLMPSSLALLMAAVSASRRAAAVSKWSAMSGMAAALGPPAGGMLVELSWRWIFFVNIPLVLAALIAGIDLITVRHGWEFIAAAASTSALIAAGLGAWWRSGDADQPMGVDDAIVVSET